MDSNKKNFRTFQSKTPYRVSLFGGGTDLPSYFNNYEGEVLGFSINYFCNIFLRRLPPFFEYKYRIVYSKIELQNEVKKIIHPTIRNSFLKFKINTPFELHHHGDLPARSGLGSSSSFTVGLLALISKINNLSLTRKQISKNAFEIERNLNNETVGYQDQIFASHGGFLNIKFKKKNEFKINAINLSKKNLKKFEDSCSLFFTGFSRYASNIESDKEKKILNKIKYYNNLKEVCREGVKVFKEKNLDIKKIGELLQTNWQAKKNLSDLVSSNDIDNIIDDGISIGAYGAKLLGAGGGGFVLFISSSDIKKKLIKYFNKLVYVPFKIYDHGVEVSE